VSRPIELVIFDCDGVLVDSERLAIEVDVVVMAELGWPLSFEEVVDLFMGRSHADVTAIIEEHLVMKLPPDWGEEFRPLYEEAFKALQPVAGVEDALDRLTVPTCVASSGSHRTIRRTLERVGLYERFKGRIFSASDVARGKPAPDLFLDAAEMLDTPPEACLVVEDSPFGIEAARAAGMRALAYAGGGLISVRELEGPGTVVFHDMADLPYLVAVASGEIEV
jgi:HAD superfamily hydrolase (TIGR01509 family)